MLDNYGNVYVTGRSYQFGSYLEYTTIKYDNSGVEQWVAAYDGYIFGSDYATAIAVDPSGNIFVTGYSTGGNYYNDYATVKYDNNGSKQWVGIHDGSANTNDKAMAIAIDQLGNIYVTGYSEGLNTFDDILTIKYSQKTCSDLFIIY